MITGPLKTDTLIQLMTATGLPSEFRDEAQQHHTDDQAVTLEQQKDFTFTLAFANGESLRLSFAQGEALAGLLAG